MKFSASSIPVSIALEYAENGSMLNALASNTFQVTAPINSVKWLHPGMRASLLIYATTVKNLGTATSAGKHLNAGGQMKLDGMRVLSKNRLKDLV